MAPNASTTSQSSRDRPRSAGRAISISTSALTASRTQTIVVGWASSKRSLATPAPNCTDRMPMSTSQIGEIARPAPREADEFAVVTGSI